MTGPAPPIPKPLPPRPPLRRRIAALGAIMGAALVASAIAAVIWQTLIREPPPGPLANDISESMSIGRHPGKVWTYGHPIAYNLGEEPVVLERIWLVNPTPGLDVVETLVAGPNRKFLFAASDREWPSEGLTDLHPVAGFRVAPYSQPAGERGVELVFALRAARPGRYVSRAVGIDYTVDGDKHRLYLSYGLGVCVTAASKPRGRNCRPPDTLRPDEIDEK